MPRKKMTKHVTIADVAGRAGVSSMTVSRVINRESNVKPVTRQKVEAAINELNYAPNIAARSLAGAKACRICLLYGNPSSAYLGELLLGALEAASEAGARMIIERTSPDLNPRALETCFGKEWDAIIVPPPMSDIAGIRALVRKHNFPAAFISSATEPGRANEIRIDDKQAAYEMTKFLITKGHKKIGFIKGHPNQTASALRYEGYVDALTEGGVNVRKAYIAQGRFTYRSGEQAGKRLLAVDDRPTAIFASNDDMAAGVLAAAGRYGLSVPADLSIAGFDDSPLASIVWPQLTTLAQPVAKMAAQAVNVVARAHRHKMQNKDNAFATIIMPYAFIDRGTVQSV